LSLPAGRQQVPRVSSCLVSVVLQAWRPQSQRLEILELCYEDMRQAAKRASKPSVNEDPTPAEDMLTEGMTAQDIQPDSRFLDNLNFDTTRALHPLR